ncbi:MAG: DUF3592 domain-containing protein [Polaromonas sp.]|nr:DUF3592 domain-containing protein [Polaromonas sp.]
MKFFALLLVIFSALFSLFGFEEKKRVETMMSIAASPGVAPATMYGITRTLAKSNSYRVQFKYFVDGAAYSTSTSDTDENGARRYAADPAVEVVYDTRKPSVATLRRYYELRDKRESVGRALVVSGILALAIALPAALIIAWPLGWLRRKKKTTT